MTMTKRLNATRLLSSVALVAALLSMAACATGPTSTNQGRYGTTYGPPPPAPSGPRASACPSDRCGVVRDVGQVYIQGDNQAKVLGTVIGAVVGGLAGHQVGGGSGKTLATVAGAVAGGAVGHEVAKRKSGDVPAWRVVVQLDDGRMATVTQRENPDVRQGDYVRIEGNRVYRQ